MALFQLSFVCHSSMSLKCPLLQLNVLVTVQYCSKIVLVTAQSYVGHGSKLVRLVVVHVGLTSAVDQVVEQQPYFTLASVQDI